MEAVLLQAEFPQFPFHDQEAHIPVQEAAEAPQ
jgi:hypothetical protein